MVRDQLATPSRGIRSPSVLRAMAEVPRHEFVPDELRPEAYADHPLPIGFGQTISQPFIVAYMSEVLDLRPGDRVLEIGTGSGYQAAILAKLVREVHTVEIVPALALRAEAVLRRLGFTNVRVHLADGNQGWPAAAPFDAVIVTCAPARVPTGLMEQLSDAGRMIIPVGDLSAGQELLLVRKLGNTAESTSLIPVRFVPMTGQTV